MIGPRFPGDPGKLRPNRLQSGRPFFWTLIAAKDASFLAHFIHRDIGLTKGPENRPSLAAIRAQKEGPVNSQGLVSEFREILRKLRPTRHQSGRPSFWAIIAAKNASFLAHFSHHDVGLQMTTGKRPSLAAIRAQKERPVNSH